MVILIINYRLFVNFSVKFLYKNKFNCGGDGQPTR
mgnify:FL=1